MSFERKVKIPEYYVSVELSDSRTVLKAPHRSFTLKASKEMVGEALNLLEEGTTLDRIIRETDLNEEEALSIVNQLKDANIVQEEHDYSSLDGYYHRYFSNVQLADELKDYTLLIVGAGPLADRLLSGLSGLELGKLLLFDSKEVNSQETSMYHSDVSACENRDEQLQKLYDNVTCIDSVEKSELPEHIDLVVVCDERNDFSLRSQMNKTCLEKGIPLLNISVEEDTLEIGPFVLPGETPCLQCYRERAEANTENLDFRKQYRSNLESSGKSYSLPKYVLGAVETVAVDEILAGITEYRQPETLGNVIEINIHPYQLDNHSILKHPDCPSCRDSNG